MPAATGRSSRTNRSSPRRRSIPATVPDHCLDRLKRYRAIATHHDKTAPSYQAMIDLTTLLIRLRGHGPTLVTSANSASLRLFRTAGYERIGVMRSVGYKLGKDRSTFVFCSGEFPSQSAPFR
ncbi:hypothetical protein SAMN04487905_102377 [Actinopolyspora xinjiangensis]|uniref:Uncharacterized protein n=1 Tax=Actinopolyspora xinjiangensis TaxID=405564 RepID=A0A1H0QUD6_9ACTN|nr:hypothetical protein SAMN04487905_102377 [Actinopolyspora xinjiangensis]